MEIGFAPKALYERSMDWSNAIFHGLLNIICNQVLAFTKSLVSA